MSRFLEALNGVRKEGPPPVWLMRQAGRYLPEYQAIRRRIPLAQMFSTPEVAAEVTLLPIDILGVDAAILFSDILVAVEMLGLKALYQDGTAPRIIPRIETPQQVDALKQIPACQANSYVARTIQLLEPLLNCPLIGFVGGPFTLACYCLEEGATGAMQKMRFWMEHHPEALKLLLEKLTVALVDLAKLQIEAGVEALQIFDSWAGVLPKPLFERFALPYLKKLTEQLKPLGVPILLFTRHSASYVTELAALGARGISLSEDADFREIREQLGSQVVLQGNLSPDLLSGPVSEVVAATQRLLQQMGGDPAFIVNLAHGVTPAAKVECVRALVDTVRNGSAAAW